MECGFSEGKGWVCHKDPWVQMEREGFTEPSMLYWPWLGSFKSDSPVRESWSGLSVYPPTLQTPCWNTNSQGLYLEPGLWNNYKWVHNCRAQPTRSSGFIGVGGMRASSEQRSHRGHKRLGEKEEREAKFGHTSSATSSLQTWERKMFTLQTFPFMTPFVLKFLCDLEYIKQL